MNAGRTLYLSEKSATIPYVNCCKMIHQILILHILTLFVCMFVPFMKYIAIDRKDMLRITVFSLLTIWLSQ